MKKFVFVSMLLSLLINSKVWADENAFHGRFYLEPEVMAAVSTDGTDTTAFLGGRAGRELTSWFDIEIESGWAEFNGEIDGENVADVSIIPLLGSIKLHLGQREKFDPYLLLGFGISFNDINFDKSKVIEVVSREVGEDLNGAGIDLSADLEDSFAYQVGGGLLYHFNERWSIFAEARFFHTSPDASVRASANGETFEDTIDNNDIDVFFFGVGARIRI